MAGGICPDSRLSIRSPEEVESGKIVYGSESDIEKFMENLETHQSRTGVILNSYDGQLNVEDGKYESGKNFACQGTVGKGCFGCVKVCIDTKNRSSVFVMKEIDIKQKEESGMKEKAIKSALREVKAFCRLKHTCKHIVKLIGLIVEPNKIYILMEKGGDQVNRIRKNMRVPTTQILLEWFLQLLSGLAYMHEKGFVHCDLHFGNILINDWNVLKICDLGSAKPNHESLFTISHGYTAHYFPPSVIKLYLERKRQEMLDSPEKQNSLDTLQRTVAPRLDLYASGKLFLEIVTGKDMIRVEDLGTAIESKQKWDNYLQKTIPIECSDKLKYFITNLMSYTTNDGFENAQDALKVLGEAYIEEKMREKMRNNRTQPMPPLKRRLGDMEAMETN